MARRRLLTREALARQLDPPADEREIARHFTLTREDLDWVSILGTQNWLLNGDKGSTTEAAALGWKPNWLLGAPERHLCTC
ncbi:MAG: transposase [Novosphingobium lindaniclasticum]|jgi:hypothetical protein|uniref:hypothetical protein n=1 Tax=Novosphingobium lindaniclasticum TaxID=1329895 RepID=UPI0024097A4F|nr:hypothetical protein [Novosphingobium lindaniclasticum]MDF2640604.1 transposase [Novosphingobium lindaniclasticum]